MLYYTYQFSPPNLNVYIDYIPEIGHSYECEAGINCLLFVSMQNPQATNCKMHKICTELMSILWNIWDIEYNGS